jgi:transcriptional regulator with XRE-family HTH domain
MPSARPPLRCLALSALREARGVTVEELAAATGLSAQRIRQIERGRPVPRPSRLAAVLDALGSSREENELVELALETTLPEEPAPAAAPFEPPAGERR